MAARAEARPLTFVEEDARRSARARRLLEGFIFYVLLSLIPLTAIPYGTVEEWWESPFECAVFALTALWSVEGFLGGGRWLVREHRLLAPLAPLLGLVFLQTVALGGSEVAGVGVWRTWSADAYETRLVAFRLLALILVAAMLLRYTSNKRRLKALIYSVTVACVASALFGVVRQAAHHDKGGFLLPHLQPQLGYGQFINNNHFALLMEMGLGLSLGLLAGGGARRQGRQMFLYLSAAVLMWAAQVLSNSRGGLFAMFGQIIFICLLWRVVHSRGGAGHLDRRRGVTGHIVRYGLAVCTLFVVIAGAVWVGGEQLVQRVETLQSEVGEEGAGNRMYPRRVEMWRATWEMIKDRPLAGSGFGGYWVAINSYYDASGVSVPQQAHNDYLELLASGGLLAAALVTWFVGALFVRVRRHLRSRRPFRRAACFGALAGLCAVALHSLVDFGLHVTVNALVFTALVVITVTRASPDGDAQASDVGGERSLPLRRPGRAARHAATQAWVVATCLLICAAAAWVTARAGLSRWYSTSHAREYSLASAERAVQLSPSDPVAHSFRARLLWEGHKDAEAEAEFARAVALRPRDYLLWMGLGFARARGGDAAGALAAAQEAARLAPFYAQPRWALGTALLRTGESQRAFVEFSRAAAGNPEYLPQTLDLLWRGLGGDARAMVEMVAPQNPQTQLALAHFFAEHDKIGEAAALLRQAGGYASRERLELTARLVSAKRFTEAYEVWSCGAGAAEEGRGGGAGSITNGNFERDINPTDPGFGWRMAQGNAAFFVAFDTKEPREGARSLLLKFSGDSPTRTPLVSQLILVEANTLYRLDFSARTEGLTTTGPPTVELIDAGGDGEALIKQTLLPDGDSGWRTYTSEFVTGQAAGAVLLIVRREECPLQPCLISGKVWLDDFSLQKF
jgi:O-antigen ligase/tetratricopeptide (TPR) repeat protein